MPADSTTAEARLRNLQRDAVIQKHIKQNGLLNVNPKEAPLLPKMRADQAKMSKLSDEKLALAERACRLLEKYVAELDGDFQRLKDMGYQLGEAEAAAQAVAQAQVAAANAAMPALDFSSTSNKKRLSGAGLPGGNKMSPINSSMGGMPSPGVPSASMQNFQNNPYAANANPFQGTNLQNNTYQTMQAGMNSVMYANMGQYNGNPMSAQQQQLLAQQFQGQPGQFQQNQFQMQGVPNMQGGSQASRDASRPHRPSRLSSSFSATGAGPHTQILPTTAAAHMPPQSSGLAGHNQSNPGSNKRQRPLQANVAGRNKKKKRIVETDDESAADDASGPREASEDVDAEGEEEDAEGEDDKSMLSYPSSQQIKRPGNQKIVSRAGTPSGTNKNAQNKAGAAARKSGKKQEDEEEDAEADAEGEEEWAQEVDETNADDPTLYCFCHRVSYGNVRYLFHSCAPILNNR